MNIGPISSLTFVKDSNVLLRTQLNIHNSTKTTMEGRHKVMSYEDIAAAQRRRSEKDTATAADNMPRTAFDSRDVEPCQGRDPEVKARDGGDGFDAVL